MKFSAFWLLFPLIITLPTSLTALQTIYISNASSCETSACDGTISSPYPGLIYGISSAIEKANSLNDYSVSLLLTSAEYTIIDNHLAVLANKTSLFPVYNATYQLFERNLTINKTLAFAFLSVKPAGCENISTGDCAITAKIHLKTENFSFTMANSTIFENIVFLGNDLPFRHQNILNPSNNSSINTSCLNQESAECCSIESLSRNSSENRGCFIVKADDSQRKFQQIQDYQYGLLVHKHDNTSLFLVNCEFRYIIAIGTNSVDTFSFLIGSYLDYDIINSNDPNITKNLMNLQLKIQNCAFEGDYFFHGLVYYTNNRANFTNIEIFNSTFENYNAFEIIDQSSYYNDFIFIVSNASFINISEITVLNCFKIMYLDYANTLSFNHVNISYDNAKQLQNLTIIYENINIINGDNHNIYQVSDINLMMKLQGPFTNSDKHVLFQAKNNNSMTISNEIFENLTNVAYFDYNSSSSLSLTNIQIKNSQINNNVNLFNFNMNNNLTVNNCSLENLTMTSAIYFLFQSVANVNIYNISLKNSITGATGGFLNCAAGFCTISLSSSLFDNLTSVTNPPLFFFSTNCYLTITLCSFSSFLSQSQGGLIYGDTWNTLLIYDSQIASIKSNEGAIIYIKNNNIFLLNNTNTSNSSSSIGFLYYGREASNKLTLTNSNISNFQGTAVAQLLDWGYITIQNCNFFNGANNHQKALIAYGGPSTTISISQIKIFTGTFDSDGWSAIFLEKTCVITLENSEFHDFTGNSAGVLYASASNTITISSISATNLITNTQGAIVLETGNTLNLLQSHFSNIITYTTGGVLSLNANNKVSFSESSVYNATATFFGACIFASESNELSVSSSNFSLLTAKSKGAFLYAVGENVISLQNLNISQLLAEAGSVISLNLGNSLVLQYSLVTNATAIRYGALIYSFSKNSISIQHTNFSEGDSQILAAGFYLDIFNEISIQNTSFANFLAVEAGAVFVTIFNNKVFVENCRFFNLSVQESNDAVVGRFGQVTNVSIINSFFDGLYGEMPCQALLLDDENSILIENSSFFNVSLAKSSGFLLARSDNVVSFQGFSLKFSKILTENQGVLIQFITNNTVNFTNFSVLATNFETLLDFEANCRASLRNISIDPTSYFTNLLIIKNNSDISVFSLNFLVNSQQISVSDSVLSLRKMQFLFRNAQIPQGFLTISNTKLVVSESLLKIRGKESCVLFLNSISFSRVFLYKSTFIGFNTTGNAVAGVVNSQDSKEFIVKSCLFLLNKAGLHGGAISYFTVAAGNYSVNRRRILQENSQKAWENINFKRNLFVRNTAGKGFGGGLYISNGNYEKFVISAQFHRNHFRLNKATTGGALYISNLLQTEMNLSSYSQNRAVPTANTTATSQGGALYYQGLLTNSILLQDSNIYYENYAQIAGALYLAPLNLQQISFNLRFEANGYTYFGRDIATPVSRISFKPPPNTKDLPVDATISSISLENIQSGHTYADCLLQIMGVDAENSVSYETSDDFSSKLTIIERQASLSPSALLKYSTINGTFCVTSLTRTSLPINSRTTFEFIFGNSEANSRILQQNSQVLSADVEFRNCEIGEKLTQSFQCETCPQGTYSLVKDFSYIVDNCRECTGVDFSCQAGGVYAPNAGLWRYSNISSNFIQCPKENNCLGGVLVLTENDIRTGKFSNIFDKNSQPGDMKVSAVGFCEVGYKGILCNECDQEYGKVNAYTCLKCKSEGYGFWVLFQILFKLAILFASLHISLKTSVGLYMEDISELDIKLTNLIKIMLNHIQMLIVLFTFVDFSQIYNNVISFCLGVNTNLGESLNLECLLKNSNWDLSPLYFEFWITVLYIFPLALICFIYVKIMHRVYEKKYKKALPFSLLYLSCILIVLQLCYFDIINVTLKLYPCFNVSDDYDVENRLVFDYSIRCEDRTQTIVKYAAGLPIVLLFGIGFPLILLLILNRNSKFNTLRTDDSLLAFGYFFFIYEEQFFFWDILQLLRKFSMTLIQILLASRILVQKFASLEVLLLVVFSFLCLQLKMRPYLKPNFDIVNKLERFSLLSLTFSFYFALYHTGLQMTNMNMLTSELTLFLLALLINVVFLIYWSYIFFPQQLLSTWLKIKGFGLKIFECLQKKKQKSVNNISNSYPKPEGFAIENKEFHNNQDPKSMTILNFDPNTMILPSSSRDFKENPLKNDNTSLANIPNSDRNPGESNTFIDNMGSKTSFFLDSERKDSQITKTFLFQKAQKRDHSFIPVEQHSFPTIPDFEEDFIELGFVGGLNNQFFQRNLLRLSYEKFYNSEYREEIKNGVELCWRKDIEEFNKNNFVSKNTKMSMFANEFVMFADENVEVSIKIGDFAENSRVLRLESLITKKKSTVHLLGIKLKMDSNHNSYLFLI